MPSSVEFSKPVMFFTAKSFGEHWFSLGLPAATELNRVCTKQIERDEEQRTHTQAQTNAGERSEA